MGGPGERVEGGGVKKLAYNQTQQDVSQLTTCMIRLKFEYLFINMFKGARDVQYYGHSWWN